MNNVSNDRLAQIAQDALYELDWEMSPTEARETMELQARIDIDLWLQTGRTDQFKE